jgi:hypothetical protein
MEAIGVRSLFKYPEAHYVVTGSLLGVAKGMRFLNKQEKEKTPLAKVVV